jgi:DNA end-binding protein Ku
VSAQISPVKKFSGPRPTQRKPGFSHHYGNALAEVIVTFFASHGREARKPDRDANVTTQEVVKAGALALIESRGAVPSRPRAFWKGYLRLSLVSIGVELYTASVSADTTALHQIHKPSGKRVRYEKVVPGLGPIDASDIVKGFEIGDDSYVMLEPEELDEIKLESSRSIELSQFVDSNEIDMRYFDRPFYVVPEGDVSTEGLLVMREALRSTGTAGIGKLTIRGRENLVAVTPFGNGLLLETLRYANELRSAGEFFDDIPAQKVDKEMVALAIELIERRTKPFEPGIFHDAYAVALEQLVERKRKGQAVMSVGEEERRPAGKVINLIDALRRALAKTRNAAPAPEAAQSREERVKRARLRQAWRKSGPNEAMGESCTAP